MGRSGGGGNGEEGEKGGGEGGLGDASPWKGCRRSDVDGDGDVRSRHAAGRENGTLLRGMPTCMHVHVHVGSDVGLAGGEGGLGCM